MQKRHQEDPLPPNPDRTDTQLSPCSQAISKHLSSSLPLFSVPITSHDSILIISRPFVPHLFPQVTSSPTRSYFCGPQELCVTGSPSCCTQAPTPKGLCITERPPKRRRILAHPHWHPCAWFSRFPK